MIRDIEVDVRAGNTDIVHFFNKRENNNRYNFNDS